MTPPPALPRETLRVAFGSVLLAALLSGLKLWAFWQTGALSIAASLADSALDLMTSLGLLAALLYAAKPADEDHTFGHTSAEDLAALGQALLIALSAFGIGGTALRRLWLGNVPALQAEALGLWVMALSLAATLSLVLWQTWALRRVQNRIIAADRLHYLTDLLPGIGALIALWASKSWGVFWLDPLIGLVAALFLLAAAWRLGRGAFDALMDRRADPALLREVAEIASGWPGVRGFHDLKSRMAGSRVFVQIHIELDGAQTLSEAHDIGAGLRRAILARFPQLDVIVHKDVFRPEG